MRKLVLPGILFVLIGLTRSNAQTPATCVLRLRMDAHGRVYEAHNRFTHAALVRRLQAGCPAGNGPMQVFLSVSPNTRYGSVKDFTDLVTQSAPPGTNLAFALSRSASAQ